MAKVTACIFFVIFLVERIGRRWSLIVGASLMGSYMLIIAVLTATYPPDPKATSITSTGIASVAMVYLESS